MKNNNKSIKINMPKIKKEMTSLAKSNAKNKFS
jgi:hypothetical protein